MIRVIVAGASGWVGKALLPAIAAAPDLELAGAVSRSLAGQEIAPGITAVATLAEALRQPADVVIDYTHPDLVAGHVREALDAGCRVIVGTSGLGAADYEALEAHARGKNLGIIAAGNFSLTATLLKRFALMAARHIPDVELIDYASAKKPDAPSGTTRELAEALAAQRLPSTVFPVSETRGVPQTRGGAVGAGEGVQVHAVRLPSYILSVEAIFGMADERLTLRHDAGASAAPYVAGTLLAARKVLDVSGLIRGLETLID